MSPIQTLISSRIAGPVDQLRELWRFRELLYFLSWKEIKVRYQQTVMGAAWAVLQPLVMMAVFSVFFGKLARLPSNGVPYPLFYYSALVPWVYFSVAVNSATQTIVTNSNLVKKVYFPRLLLPLASAAAAFLDFCIALVLLFGLALFLGADMGLPLVWLPLFAAALVVTTVTVSVWSSALNATYRDLRYAVPMAIQVWLFVSPVAYPSTLIPDRWRWLYDLNPLAGLIEGFRWSVTGVGSVPGIRFGVSIGVVLIALVVATRYFWRAEATFADVV